MLISTSEEQSLDEFDQNEKRPLEEVGSITMSAEDRVFELFLSHPYREYFYTPYKRVLDIYRAANIKEPATPTAITPESRMEIDNMNKHLAKYYGAELGKRQYDVLYQPVANKVSGLPPLVDNRSVFYSERDHSFRKSLFTSHQVMMALFDIIIFTVVDITIHSPVIGAICSFCCDYLIEKTWKGIAILNLRKKALYDRRLY